MCDCTESYTCWKCQGLIDENRRERVRDNRRSQELESRLQQIELTLAEVLGKLNNQNGH